MMQISTKQNTKQNNTDIDTTCNQHRKYQNKSHVKYMEKG